MKKQLFTLLLVAFSTFAAFAQMAEPVKWTFEAQKVGKTEYQVKLTATIQEGWYVYSQTLPQGGPVPTQIDFEQNPNLLLDGKPVEVGTIKEEFDNTFNIKVTKLMGVSEFIQTVKVKGGVDEIKGKLTFMTCNGEMCMPPKNVAFKVNLD